ncbi:response regulator [Pararhizobium arenae]|uniref:response regulator n=1 Tax=Pararhizobium arenae TaxID=1856850 RepID=UPI00094B6DA5|nr:response regulator [Pararhizobium arenae]
MCSSSPVIAIVDDDKRVLQALLELLESAGYEALPFDSPNALLDSGVLYRITIVVTDIGMPEINGFELKRILHLSNPEISVILITGRYELIEGLSADDDSLILRKPFDSSALLSAISRSCR